jgi:RNA:NAD 2'-phosphotransferase (TPT1/KptA family)
MNGTERVLTDGRVQRAFAWRKLVIPLMEEMTDEAYPVKDDFYHMSHELTLVLRHATSYKLARESTLGMDSGGWFRLDSLATHYQRYGCKRLIEITKDRSVEWWKAFILAAISFGGSRSDPIGKIRMQVAVEISRDRCNGWSDEENEEWYPWAIRATNGHSFLTIDPYRMGATMDYRFWEQCPVLYHVTALENLEKIMETQCLLPGHKCYRSGRRDIHFTPFPPLDMREVLVRKRMEKTRVSREELIVFCCDTKVLMDDNDVGLRFNAGAGIPLCFGAVKRTAMIGAY